MEQMNTHRAPARGRRPASRTLLVALFLGMGGISACQLQQQSIVQHEDNLAAAGFIVRLANTPERQAMLLAPRDVEDDNIGVGAANLGRNAAGEPT
jgi:hypothetical protein